MAENMFPLVQLSKKLKVYEGWPCPMGGKWFPLVQLSKKLKVSTGAGDDQVSLGGFH